MRLGPLATALLLASGLAGATEDNFDASDPLEIVVYILDDDVPRGYYEMNLPPTVGAPDFFPEQTASTPSITALADDGFRHHGFHSYTVCTPTRQTHAGLGAYHHAGHSGGIILVEADGVMDPNFFVRTLWRQMGDAGYRSVFYGKWHMSAASICDPAQEWTDLWAAGIDESPAYMYANVLEDAPCLDYFGGEGGSNCWANCRGHNCWMKTSFVGAAAPANIVVEGFTSDILFDELIDDITGLIASSIGGAIGGKHFFTLWLSAPHVPVRSGTGPGTCFFGLDQNDWPPGSAAVGDDHTCFKEQVEYNDSRLGELKTLLETTPRRMIVHTSDNGYPTTQTNWPALQNSKGQKKSVWPGGTWVHFVAWGDTIPAGKTMSEYHHAPQDFAPTILGLVGGTSVNGWGQSFSNCILELGGSSATECWGRTNYNSLKFKPPGGISGDVFRLPDVTNDPQNMWEKIEWPYEGVAADGKNYIFYRRYDGATPAPYEFLELLIECDPASDLGRYCELGTEILKTESGEGPIDETTLTPEQEAFVLKGRAAELRRMGTLGKRRGGQ